MAAPPKFNEAEQYLFNLLVDSLRSNMSRALNRDSEILALRAAVLKLAELNPTVRSIGKHSVNGLMS